MTDDPQFYNLEEVEDLARKVLPKAVSTNFSMLLSACLLVARTCFVTGA